ncbi:MAG: hypothetical protein EP336_12970 [Rhodobacteraceae bacterium]|nr:MAG: hypothetical protein EP336_12970 [Paracoccaceae bacterium]
MDPKPLHPDVLEFISSLQKLETILLKYEKGFWAKKLSRVRQISEKSDGYCVELFLGFFGGMGSLNDLVLIAPRPVNDEFEAELRRAYKLAQALQ